MAATQVLAPGTTAVDSADIVVPAGQIHTVGIYTDSVAGLAATQGMTVFARTPSQPIPIGQLTGSDPTRGVPGPITVFGRRPMQAAGAVNLGLWKDTA